MCMSSKGGHEQPIKHLRRKEVKPFRINQKMPKFLERWGKFQDMEIIPGSASKEEWRNINMLIM